MDIKIPMKNNLNLYRSINEITLYAWDRFGATKDNNWFIVGYDGRQKKIESEELLEIENNIVEEYFKAVNDNSFASKIKKWAEVDNLKLKYKVCNALLERMWLGFSEEEMSTRYRIISELKKWGLKFPEINSLDNDADLIVRYRHAIEGISTQIAMISRELKEDAVEEKISLNKRLQLVTIGLNYPYRLDPKVLTLAEWIEICDLLNEKNKQ